MHILSHELTTTLLEWFSGREENDRRNYFKINLHESIGPGRDRTRDPWICIQSRIGCQTRYRLCKRLYWIQPNLFGDLLTRVGEQEHYRFLFFGSPLHGPQWVCIFWLCCLFVSNLNKLCIQELIFGYPTERSPVKGSKVSAHSSFMLIQTCWAEFNLICWKVDFLTSGEC